MIQVDESNSSNLQSDISLLSIWMHALAREFHVQIIEVWRGTCSPHVDYRQGSSGVLLKQSRQMDIQAPLTNLEPKLVEKSNDFLQRPVKEKSNCKCKCKGGANFAPPFVRTEYFLSVVI